MQGLENNNWIILNPLGNIYEIHANLTVITLFKSWPLLRTFSRKIVRQYFFLSQMWTYSKYLLTGISANSTFRTVSDFKKLKIKYSWDIYYFFAIITSICLSQISLINQNELYWEQILTRPSNVMPRIVTCNTTT